MSRTDEFLNNGRADESCRAGDENMHLLILLLRACPLRRYIHKDNQPFDQSTVFTHSVKEVSGIPNYCLRPAPSIAYPTSLNQRNIVARSWPIAASTWSSGNSWNRIDRPVAFVNSATTSGSVNSSPARSMASPRKSLGRLKATAPDWPISLSATIASFLSGRMGRVS